MFYCKEVHRGGYRGWILSSQQSLASHIGCFSTPWDLERKVLKGKNIENHDICSIILLKFVKRSTLQGTISFFFVVKPLRSGNPILQTLMVRIFLSFCFVDFFFFYEKGFYYGFRGFNPPPPFSPLNYFLCVFPQNVSFLYFYTCVFHFEIECRLHPYLI